MDDQEQNTESSPFGEEVEKAEKREETYARICSELREKPEIKKLAEEYQPTSVENYVKDYAKEKTDVLEWAPQYAKWRENEEMEWTERAHHCLYEIQQKKLFDIQCLWRAEQMDLGKEVICLDFLNFGNNVFNCTFVPPVTQSEVDLYIQYLQSGNYETQLEFLMPWQQYESLKKAYNNEDADFPEWYEFYNGRMGTGMLMLLPDIRGEKERFYYGLEHDARTRAEHEAAAKPAPAPQPDAKPVAAADPQPTLNSTRRGFLSWFIRTFEDKETLELAEAAGAFHSLDDPRYELMELEEYLEKAREPMPVEPCHDWREALGRALATYTTTKIARALPLAFDAYLMRLEAGIPFQKQFDHPGHDETIRAMHEEGVCCLKEGRRLNGEPENMDF